ncbi:MAG TPA: succinate dehydrogenase, cytochrome b556 subunit [Burkholderiaceae bacterium]|nr:succinate dehydrogenase, cytochrome b556 subunit [Burkholderiaceae bacterium]
MTTSPTPAATPRREIRNISIGDLSAYRLPPPGVVSILHRVSGVLMFLLLPFVLWLLDLSLTSEDSFERLRAAAQTPLVRIVASVLAWGFLHHLAAGVRFLLLDLHVGVDKPAARRSAVIVLATGIVLGIAAALWIFGVL